MDDKTKASLEGQLRVLLGCVAGWFIGKGYVTAEVANALIGLLVLLWPLVWSWISHKRAEERTVQREVAAVNAGVAVAQAGEVGQTVRPEDVKQIIRDFAPPKVTS